MHHQLQIPARFQVERGHNNHNAQALVTCANGWRASVVRGPYTYGGDLGLFELAVFRPKHLEGTHEALCYTTPITNDVIGYLTPAAVLRVLDLIAALPPCGPDGEPSTEAYAAFEATYAEQLRALRDGEWRGNGEDGTVE